MICVFYDNSSKALPPTEMSGEKRLYQKHIIGLIPPPECVAFGGVRVWMACNHHLEHTITAQRAVTLLDVRVAMRAGYCG